MGGIGKPDERDTGQQAVRCGPEHGGDSMNTVSPRFVSEIFSKKSQRGYSLSIDSSVFTVLTPDDPNCRRSGVRSGRREAVRKYIPFRRSSTRSRTIPIPLDWRLGRGVSVHRPAIGKSKSEQAVQPDESRREGRPRLQVKKRGFSISCSNSRVDQVRASRRAGRPSVAKTGEVKFLNFREALERLKKNVRLERRFVPRQASAAAGTLPEGARLTDEQGGDAGLRDGDMPDGRWRDRGGLDGGTAKGGGRMTKGTKVREHETAGHQRGGDLQLVDGSGAVSTPEDRAKGGKIQSRRATAREH